MDRLSLIDRPKAASRGTASPFGRKEGQAASRGTASPFGRKEGQAASRGTASPFGRKEGQAASRGTASPFGRKEGQASPWRPLGRGLCAFGLALALSLGGCARPCKGSSDLRVVFDGQPALLAMVRSLTIGVSFGAGMRQGYLLDLEGVLEPGRALLLTPSTPVPDERYQLTIEVTGLAADNTPVVSGQLVVDLGTDSCNEITMILGVAQTDM